MVWKPSENKSASHFCMLCSTCTCTISHRCLSKIDWNVLHRGWDLPFWWDPLDWKLEREKLTSVSAAIKRNWYCALDLAVLFVYNVKFLSRQEKTRTETLLKRCEVCIIGPVDKQVSWLFDSLLTSTSIVSSILLIIRVSFLSSTDSVITRKAITCLVRGSFSPLKYWNLNIWRLSFKMVRQLCLVLKKWYCCSNAFSLFWKRVFVYLLSIGWKHSHGLFAGSIDCHYGWDGCPEAEQNAYREGTVWIAWTRAFVLDLG